MTLRSAQELAQAVRRPDAMTVLGKAFLKAGRELGLTQEQLGRIVGRNRTSLHRGIDPESKAGELAKMFIRCYRGLHVLVGGDTEIMRHWMSVENRHTGGVPARQVQTVPGLARVLDYLDAMRGKA